MCELLALSTRHAAHLNVSLEALVRRSGPACGTRDGWGAAFYQGNDAVPGNRRCGECPHDLPEQLRECCEQMAESPQG